MANHETSNQSVDYGGSNSPGPSIAAEFGTGYGGEGVLPGAEFGYYGPGYGPGYFGPFSGYGAYSPYSAGNWYRPELGEGRGDAARQRGRAHPSGGYLHDTLTNEGGGDFAPGPFGEGDDYYGPSYNWDQREARDTYGSFGPDSGYGPGNWFNPNRAPDQGGPPGRSSAGSFPGYGQPYSPVASAVRGTFHGVGPRGYQRSDARIEDDLDERLTDDPHLDAGDVVARVEQGIVTLTGTVPHRLMKRRAEDDARAVRGVKDVSNELRVSPPN